MRQTPTLQENTELVESADYYFLTHGTERERKVWNDDIEDILNAIHCKRPVTWEDIAMRYPMQFAMVLMITRQKMKAWRLDKGTILYYGTFAKGLRRNFPGAAVM